MAPVSFYKTLLGVFLLTVLFSLIHSSKADDTNTCLCQCGSGYVNETIVSDCSNCKASCDVMPQCQNVTREIDTCQSSVPSWAGTFNFADSECNTTTCCCATGKWTLTVSNTAVTIENSAFSGVGCPTYFPTAIHLISATSSYGYLTTSSAVWLAVRDSNGLVIQQGNGNCVGIGTTKGKGGMIAGIIIALLIVGLAIGGFIWYRRRSSYEFIK